MVRNYKKKPSKLTYTEGQLELAITSVQNGKTIKSSAERYGVPRTTLQRKFNNTSSSITGKF